MENIKEFLNKYWGGLLGAVIAIVLVCTGLDRLIIGIVFTVGGFIAGNYIQNNKDDFKKKIKSIIDKM